MKTIITLSLTLFFAGTVFSQETQEARENSQIRTLVTLDACDSLPIPQTNESIARLYRFKNTRVIKELTFAAGQTGAKLA